MISTDLARLFEMPGPFVSLYLDTTGNLANPQIRMSLRWKSLRRELAHTGAPKAVLAAVDPLIDGPHTAGDTLVAIANLDGVQLLAHLPDAPPRDVARCGMLPDVAPLLAWRQRQLSYVVVATDRLGAELLAVVPTGPTGRCGSKVRSCTSPDRHPVVGRSVASSNEPRTAGSRTPVRSLRP